MIRVLVVAASAMVRRGLEALVASSANVMLAGSSAGSPLLRRDLEAIQPEVVLLAAEGVEAQAELAAMDSKRSAASVVLLTDETNGWLRDGLSHGLRAVLPREASSNEILAAVEAVAAGLVALHPDVLSALLPVPQAPTRAMPDFPTQPLTPREIEVLGMLADGLGNKMIAAQLKISEHTVKFHISSIFSKLNVQSRTEAVTIGVRLGLIML